MKQFRDLKSRLQIATFKTWEMHASRWRNSRNLQRWTEECRSRWELQNIGPAKKPEPIDLETLPV